MTPAGPDPDRPPDLPAGPPTAPAGGPGGPRVGWVVPLAAALVAGLVAWAGGERIEVAHTPRIVSEFQVSGNQQLAQRAAAITTRSTLAHGLLGASLGLAMGLAGGWTRRSLRGALVGAALGLVVGAAAGAGAARIVTPAFLRNEKTNVADDMILPLLTHGAIWSALGAAGGLALAIGLGGPGRRVARATLGALLGAVLGTVVYELAGGLAFPLEQTGQPISAGVGSRLFARLVVAVASAAGAVQALRGQARPEAIEGRPMGGAGLGSPTAPGPST